MKKAIVVILLLAAALLLCATAAAEKPVNPLQAEVWAYEQKPRPEKPAGVVSNGREYYMSLTCRTTPTLGGRGQWTVTLNSSVSSGNVAKVIFCLSSKDWSSDYAMTYYKVYDSYQGSFTSCPIVTAGSYKIEVWMENATRQTLAYDDYEFTIQDDAAHTSLTEKVNSVVSECRKSTQWETALSLHEWLVTHVYYDQSLEYYGADMILRGYGCCDGYSKAYYLLCKAAGIPVCRVVGGTAEGAHAWNAIKLDGKWYYVDCTWDDPLGLGNETSPKSGAESHTYFCLNKTLMQMDHNSFEWLNATEQSCTSLDANYTVHSGEWKTWGSYGWNYEENNYTVTALADEIAAAFESGDTVYEFQWSKWSEGSGGIWMWYMEKGEIHAVAIDERNMAILEYALAMEKFTLGEDPIVVRAEKTSGGMRISLKGWDVKETGTLTLPKGIGAIPADAFSGCRATTLVIQPGCTRIAAGAFRNSKIRYATIPDTVTSIAEDAFEGCSRIIFYTTSNEAIRYANAHGFPVMDP